MSFGSLAVHREHCQRMTIVSRVIIGLNGGIEGVLSVWEIITEGFWALVVYKAFMTKGYFELCLSRMRSQKRPLVCRWGRRVKALRITYQRFTNKSTPCPPMLWGSVFSGTETTELLCTNKGAEPTWRLLHQSHHSWELHSDIHCLPSGSRNVQRLGQRQSSCCPDRWKVDCAEG